MLMAKKKSWMSRIGVGMINGLSHLPLSVHYFFSDWLIYPLVYYVIGYRKKVVRQNLLQSFPEMTDKERKSIEKRFYHWFSDLVVEIIKIHSISAEELNRRVTYKGLDQIEASFDEGHKFALCYLSHYGNWEWFTGLPTLLRNGSQCQIYHPMRNKVFDQWFLDNRSQFGAVNIKMKETLRKLLALSKEIDDHPEGKVKGYMFGCIADQLPKEQNVHHTVTFLGQETKVFTGSEQLGRKLGMSIFYSRITRPKRGYYCMEFSRMDGVVDADAGEFAYTDEYMRRFDEDVRRCPELWLWTHKRWKR